MSSIDLECDKPIKKIVEQMKSVGKIAKKNSLKECVFVNSFFGDFAHWVRDNLENL